MCFSFQQNFVISITKLFEPACLYINYISFMHNYTDMIMTEDESAEIEIAIKNWSTCDLGIILLMAAVVVATL